MEKLKKVANNIRISTLAALQDSYELYKKHPYSLTLALICIFAYLSYEKTFTFNFWRDDWSILYRLKYDFRFFIKYAIQNRHPGELINYLPWIFWYDTNFFPWALHGLVLKIIASVSVGLATFAFLKSKKAGIISAILFASYFGGLEAFSWMSARLSAHLIIFIAITFYLYAQSYRGYSKKFILALMLMFATVMLEPGRAVFLPPLLIFWECAERYVTRTLLKRRLFINGLLVGILGFAGLFATSFGSQLSSSNDLAYYSNSFKNNPDRIKNFFSSLGNLVAEYYKPIYEQVGLGPYVHENAHLALRLLIMGVIIGIILVLLRKKSGPLVLLSVAWIPLFFFPGWFSDSVIVSGASHRYLALSSVGIIFILTVMVSKLPSRLAIIALVIISIIQIDKSNIILGKDYLLKGYQVTQPLYNQQNADVPPFEEEDIFLVGGDTGLRGSAFDFSLGGTLPFALARKIDDMEKIPSVGANDALIAKMLCASWVERPYIYTWKPQPFQSKIEKIYSWNVTDYNNLVNTSTATRVRIGHKTPCLSKNNNSKIDDNIILQSSFMSDKLYEKNNHVVSFAWVLQNNLIHDLSVLVSAYDQSNHVLAVKNFVMIDKDKKIEEPFITAVYTDQPVSTATVLIRYCTTICSQKELHYTNL